MAKSDAEKRQKKLFDIPMSEAARQAEKYADIADDIASKKDVLVNQGQKVIEAMEKSKQTSLTYTDQYGYQHVFKIVSGGVKLKHSKRGNS